MKKLEYATLPQSPRDLSVDHANPGKCQVTGLLTQSCDLGGETCQLIMYLPENAQHNDRCIIVVPPSNEDTVQFLSVSGLAEFADKNRCILGAVVPSSNGWDLSGRGADFVNAAYKKVQSREWFVVMQDCIYLFGFGDGATVAQQAAMKMTSEWSGLATFGSFMDGVLLNVGECRDADTGVQDGELYIASSKAQLPVWMLFQKKSTLDEQVISYWKQENANQPDPLYDTQGTVIYLPPHLQRTSKTNDEAISQTRVTLGTESANVDVLDYVWSYVGAARRHRSYGGKILRYFRDPLKNGATYHTMEVNGFVREWYEYVPARIKDSAEPVPLVVSMHGRGGNGETFFDISDLSLVAEERGFIALFPTADFYEFKKTGLKTLRLWQGNCNGQKQDSVPFIRAMVEDVKSRYPIDNGRVYACGQSSGGYMSTYLAQAASDLFAAVAPWSGFTYPGFKNADFQIFDGEYFSGGNVPILLLFGDRDDMFGVKTLDPLPDNAEIAGFIRFIRESYKLEESPAVYQCKPITYYVWRNGKGTPMLKVGIVQDMPHANYAEESRLSFDEFLSRFERRDKKLLYMGRPAE